MELSNFAQQGSVDWVALSQTTFTASLAVLSRLAGAGLEPLTIAMAQVVSLRLRISPAGEQKLRDAMASCKAFSSFGEVLWFGIGVQHVLRSLVQTTQGASIVALTAMLTEGFSLEYTALVLYEMAKLMNGPTEVAPSYSQWFRYGQLCSGLLATTTIGQKINQLSKLSGYSLPLNVLESPCHGATSAQKLAEFLFELGRIESTEVETIEVLSGLVTAWIVVLCDSFLGLRVCLYSNHGDILFQNYDSAKEKPQVAFHRASASNDRSDLALLSLKSRTFSLDSVEMVRRWNFANNGRPNPLAGLLTSRIGWATFMHDFYDVEAPNLLIINSKTQYEEAFARLFASCALIYYNCRDTQYLKGYRKPREVIEKFADILPELAPFALKAILEAEHVLVSATQQTHDSLKGVRGKVTPIRFCLVEANFRRTGIQELHDSARQQLQKLCKCGHHPFRCSTVVTIYTTIVTANLFTNAVLDDEYELNLSRLGVRHLHEEIFERSYPADKIESVAACLFTGMTLSKVDTRTDFCELFKTYIRLFTGYPPSISCTRKTRPKISAMSYGGIYCYVDFLRDPFQTELECGRVHVGRGAISLNNRTYDIVHDQDVDLSNENNTAHSETLQAPDFNSAAQHQAQAFVCEAVTLRFWYEQWLLQDSKAELPRSTINPMECLAMGWITKGGLKGAWPGVNTKSPPPTSYSAGPGSLGVDDPLDTEYIEDQLQEPNTATNTRSTKRQRQCRVCHTRGHDARNCPTSQAEPQKRPKKKH